MNFINAVKTNFIKYSNFSGRASRSEYWYFSLFLILLSCLTMAIDAIVFEVSFWESDLENSPASSITSLLVLLPSIAVSVRRLHDINRSGWWLLIGITIIGAFPLIFWAAKESDIGDNRFGSDPLEKPNEERISKPLSKWIRFLVIPFFTAGFIGLMALGLAMEVGLLSEPKVLVGKLLPDDQREKLESKNIISKEEKVNYFYLEEALPFAEFGHLLTEDRLIVYTMDEDDQYEKSEMLYKNIKTIEEAEEDGSSYYKVVGNENAAYEFLPVFYSAEFNKFKKFLSELESRLN
jgi:uncharacterized membrane protein YhaH (DUF805 family)